MSQRVVEATLGRLLCDDAFRRELARDFDATVSRYGLTLTASERDCLRRVSLAGLSELANRLDDRIRRADLEHDPAGGPDALLLQRLATCTLRESH